jgi:hypothetical protein
MLLGLSVAAGTDDGKTMNVAIRIRANEMNHDLLTITMTKAPFLYIEASGVSISKYLEVATPFSSKCSPI